MALLTGYRFAVHCVALHSCVKGCVYRLVTTSVGLIILLDALVVGYPSLVPLRPVQFSSYPTTFFFLPPHLFTNVLGARCPGVMCWYQTENIKFDDMA